MVSRRMDGLMVHSGHCHEDFTDASTSLVEKTSTPVPIIRQPLKNNIALVFTLTSIVGIGLLFAISSSKDAFLGAAKPSHGESFISLEGDDNNTEMDQASVSAVPGGVTLILNGVTGKMTDLFVPGSEKVMASKAVQEIQMFLTSTNLIEGGDKCGPCTLDSGRRLPSRRRKAKKKAKGGKAKGGKAASNKGGGSSSSSSATTDCCLRWYSGETALLSTEGMNLRDVPNPIAFVKLTAEAYMEPDLVKYERSLPLSAAQRKKFCAELKKKKVFSSKVLPATNMKDIFHDTGIPAGPALDAASTLTAQEQTAAQDYSGETLERFKKQQEFNEAAKDAQKVIDESLEKAKTQMAEAKQQASTMHDDSATKAAAALKEVTEVATKSLESMKSRMNSLELGKANLKAGEDDLKKMAAVTNNGKLAKGSKLSSRQLIAQNRMFAGRYFKQGVSDDRNKDLVVEFSSAFLSKLPAPAPPKIPASSPSPALLAAFLAPTKAAAKPDLLADLLMSHPEDSSTEYSRQTTSSKDAREAARLANSYGSSASTYVQQESAGGLSIGMPGIFSIGMQAALKTSSSSASSTQKDKEKSNSWSETSHEFHQLTVYEEPKTVIDVTPSMVQATPQFLKDVQRIRSDGNMDVAQGAEILFEKFGTHVCLHVTLGGSWTIKADANSVATESVHSLAEATAMATSKQKSEGQSFGASAGGTIMTSYGPITMGGSLSQSSGKSDASNTQKSNGAAGKQSSSSRGVFVETRQSWKGGLSGGSASDWRLSLEPAQNSNWRIISRRFEDCIPVWSFLQSNDREYAKKLCHYWFEQEINGYDGMDAKLRDELLTLVPTKCNVEPESTRPGIFRQALESAKEQAEKVATQEMLAAQGQVKETEREIATTKGQYEISGVIEETISDSGIWDWGHYLRAFSATCHGRGWKYGFPNGWKSGNKYRGYCLKGDSFEKYDVQGDGNPTNGHWNWMRFNAAWRCGEGGHNMYGGFADGNTHNENRGAVCFNQVRGKSIKTWGMNEKVIQNDGWWNIARQAHEWCKKKGYKTGMPGKAENDGSGAYNYCFADNEKVVEDLTSKLKDQQAVVSLRKKDIQKS